SRELQALGHTVRLMPPAYVKPYVKRQKNDSTGAEAICEAASPSSETAIFDGCSSSARQPLFNTPGGIRKASLDHKAADVCRVEKGRQTRSGNPLICRSERLSLGHCDKRGICWFSLPARRCRLAAGRHRCPARKYRRSRFAVPW